MAYNRHLHHLIHSFSKKENAQISRELKHRNSLLALYEHYRNLDYNTESSITGYNNALKDFKNLKNVQTQLKNVLIKTTENFEQPNVEDEVWLMTRNARTLFNRCSYNFALQQLKSAKKLALKNELYEILLQINLFECQMVVSGNLPIKYLSNKELFEEKTSYLSALKNHLDYYLLLEDLRVIILQEMTLRNPEEKNKLFKEIQENPLINDEKMAKSKRATLVRYDIQRLIATLNNQPKEVLKVVNNILQEIHKFPKEFISFIPTTYAIGYLTLIQENQILEIFDNDDYWKKLERVKGLNKKLDIFIYKVTSFLILDKLAKTESSQNPKTLKKIEEIQKEYQIYFTDLDIEGKFVIPFMLAVFWFYNEQFSRAQEWLDQFFVHHQMKPKLRKDLLNAAFLFELAIHLELKEFVPLKSKAINVQRRFKNQNILYKTEKKLLSFFKNINFFVLTKTQTFEVFYQLNTELVNIAKDNKHEHSYHSDYVNWIQWSEKNAKK